MQNTPRFYLSKSQINKKRFLLEDERSVRHMGLVLRMKVGDELILFDGEGKEYNATLGYLTKKQAAGVVQSEYEVELSNKMNLTIAQSLPRAGKLDDIVRMNTEAGVAGFLFFESEYSVAKIESFNNQKLDRLSKVALEALRQSEGIIIPNLEGAYTFQEAINQEGYDKKIILHSRNVKGSKNIVDIKEKIYSDLKKLKGAKPRILLMVGPEGGFSPKEIKLALENNFEVAYLDLPILRTETAGIVASSFLLIN